MERPWNASGPRARVRAATARDLPVLQEVERAAGRCFAEVGMPEVADDEPLPIGVLDGYRRAGLAWVAVDTADHPVAYLVAELVDADLHVAQVSVHPEHARRRVGRALLEQAARHASAIGAPALTLTTFEHVPWNAPYYLRCGFRVLAELDRTPGLRAIREQEAARGLDRWPRVCMRRDLPVPAPADR